MKEYYEELLKVGEAFTLFESWKLKDVEAAAVFEALQHESGYLQALYLKDITEEELELLSKGEVKFRFLKNEKDMVLGLMNISGSSFYIELDFDPTKYEEKRAFQLIWIDNSVHIVVIESSNLEIKLKRESYIPLRLSHAWKKSWEKMFRSNQFAEEYREWVDDLHSQYESHELWDMAKPA